MLERAGIDPSGVLRTGRLPQGLFSGDRYRISAEQWYAFWRAVEVVSQDVRFPLDLVGSYQLEAQHPLLAALARCKDLNEAFSRLSHFQQLIVPKRFEVQVLKGRTELRFQWLGHGGKLPTNLVLGDLGWHLRFVRLATGQEVKPLQVVLGAEHPSIAQFHDFFGCPIETKGEPLMVFSAADASLRFVRADPSSWRLVEPHLQARLEGLAASALLGERAKAVLLGLMPQGKASLTNLAEQMNCSPRTLQRQLSQEGLKYQGLLDETRLETARHYLEHSHYSSEEISLLLGYDSPNSFFRAFRSWTGQTPMEVRQQGLLS